MVKVLMVIGVILCINQATSDMLVYKIANDLLYNCTCPAVTDRKVCVAVSSLNATCNCSSSTRNELRQDARSARRGGVVFWTNRKTTTTVCCGNSSSDDAIDILRFLLDFAYVRILTLNNCQNLTSTERVTLFGIEEFAIQSDQDLSHPNQELNMEDSDSTNTTTEYKDYHAIRMYMSIAAGNDVIKAWSIIRRSGQNSTTENPLRRRGLSEREDGRYMLTSIYS